MNEEQRWIHIPDWEKFQHRDAGRSSVLPWLKAYTELLSKPDFLDLTFHQRGLLVSIWIEYARSKRQLRDNSLTLTRQLGHRVSRRDLDALNHAGFIMFSASRYASLEKEKEKEQPKDQNPNPRTGAADDGERPKLRVVS